jgi:hypothetical protein
MFCILYFTYFSCYFVRRLPVLVVLLCGVAGLTGITTAPFGTAISPFGTAISPFGTAISPFGTAISLFGTAISLFGTAISLFGTATATTTIAWPSRDAHSNATTTQQHCTAPQQPQSSPTDSLRSRLRRLLIVRDSVAHQEATAARATTREKNSIGGTVVEKNRRRRGKNRLTATDAVGLAGTHSLRSLFPLADQRLRQGLSRCRSRGNRTASRMLSKSSIVVTSRSAPIPQPAWGGIPYLNIFV